MQKGNTEIVRILIPYTKNPNAPDHDGRTPYQLAESLGNREIVQMLEPFCSESSLLISKRQVLKKYRNLSQSIYVINTILIDYVVKYT